MAIHVPNARKGFNFVVEVSGIPSFEVQSFTPPAIGAEVVEHGDANKSVKTAGRVTYGDATFTKLKRLPGSDDAVWRWIREAQNGSRGSGGYFEDYNRTIVVREVGPNGVYTANYWVLTGWVSNVEQSAFTRTESDNVLQTVTLAINDVEYY